MTEHAQRIITNGRLITFDESRPNADALAIRDGKIIAVGSADDVANLAGPETVIHNAGGGTVLPGFIESHVHLFQSAAELDALNLFDLNAAYTRDGAYAEFNEHRKGRLKSGLMADIVVMSDDLEGMAPEELDQARPVMTVCNGRITYQE